MENTINSTIERLLRKIQARARVIQHFRKLNYVDRMKISNIEKAERKEKCGL